MSMMTSVSTGTFVGLLAICALAQCQLFDALYTYVLDKAADTTIPVINSNQPVNVSIGMSLIQLTSLDSKSGEAEIEVWMNLRWTDTRLSWDPTTFNDTRFIRLPASRIWNPDVVLYNGHASTSEALAIVYNTGRVMHIPPKTIKTRCYVSIDDVNVTCILKFASWTYDGFLLNVVNSSNVVDLSDYMSATDWELTEQKVERHVAYYSCCQEPFPDVTFTMTFKKRGRGKSFWNILG